MNLARQRRGLVEEGGDSEEIDLVLELSTDLDEEEVPARKKKPTIVNNTRKKGESRKGQERHFQVLWTTLERHWRIIFRLK